MPSFAYATAASSVGKFGPVLCYPQQTPNNPPLEDLF